MNIQTARDFLTHLSSNLLAGCRTQATDGTWLYVPDGQAAYQALWTRDFGYMAEYAGHLMPVEELVACVEYLIRGMRADGVTPDRVNPDGKAIYVAGSDGHPMAEWNVDNGAFLTFAAHACLKQVEARQGAQAALELYRKWAVTLGRALAVTPQTRDGLVWNDPERIHSPYGWTDTVGKSGNLFMETVLVWDALQKQAVWEEKSGDAAAAQELRNRAARLIPALDVLWDEDAGVFLAATRDCRQIDVWGNAFALATGLPLGEKTERIRSWLAENFERITQRGQVRHLPAPETWQRLLITVREGEYQNGAYWATPSGWLWLALRKEYPDLAARLLDELCLDFQENGVYECVNGAYKKVESYVVSATNMLGALRQVD